MGIRSGGNIRIIDKRSKRNSVPISTVISVVSDPNAFFPPQLLANSQYANESIQIIYDKYFPTVKKSTVLSRLVQEKFNLLSTSGVHPSTDPAGVYLGTDYVEAKNRFSAARDNIENLFENKDFNPDLFRSIHQNSGKYMEGNFGDYKVNVGATEDWLELNIENFYGELVDFTFSSTRPPYYKMNGELESSEDCQLVQLLSWSILEKPALFNAILNMLRWF